MMTQSVSPRGTYLACCHAWRVVIWRKTSHPPVRVFANGYGTHFTAVSWSPDGSIVVAGNATGEVLAWHLKGQEMLFASRYPNHCYPIIALAWSPTYDYLAALTEGNQIQIWDMVAYRCIAVLACACDARTLTWSSDGLELQTNTGECWVP
jgi:WD40 repeat protein